MEIVILVISLFAIFFSTVSYKFILSLRDSLMKTEKEIVDLRKYINQSVKELKTEILSIDSVKKKRFNTNMSVGEVLAKHPDAKNVLAMFHLGACTSCSITDSHNFGEALKEYDINQVEILDTLNSLLDGSVDFNIPEHIN
ncbi:MAG: hypothetical protein CMG74_09185 [Candidatus Marinimicrobia bacterium]|nr:hypothetical protein [Candidatus Neomarinimicrobiota bacterium]